MKILNSALEAIDLNMGCKRRFHRKILPIGRVVGRRTARVGLPPNAITRAAMASMATYRTRCPKGVFY